MLMSKSTRNMLNAKYALRADSKITSHPISWLTSAALHASAIHFLANSICGWSIARDMRTVDAVEMFLLGCLWCGCLQTFWGLLRPTMAIGSSGMGSLSTLNLYTRTLGGICGLLGYATYQNWDDNRKIMGLLIISDVIRWINRNFELSIPCYFSFRLVCYLVISTTTKILCYISYAA